MNITVLIIMFVALYLLYRIAYPKQAAVKQGDAAPLKRETDLPEVMGKSRFVVPDRSKPLQTAATSAIGETNGQNAITFAAENEKRNPVVPPEKLDEVFGEDINPEDLDIEPDENETDGAVEVDEEEESEDLRLTLGRDAETAAGMTIEEMAETVEAIEQPTDENAALLYRVETTDLFEKLVSGDRGKAERIKALIERHVRSLNPEVENEDSNNDNSEWKSFDMRNFLSKTGKK
jgi:hypothetical protein